MAIPLPILLTLIASGIACALLFTHLMGWSSAGQIDSSEAALARFQLDYPDAEPTDIWVASDGSSALLAVDGAVGLVTVLGDRTVVRRLGRGTIASVRTDPAHTHLKLRDPGFPRLRLSLSDTTAREVWLARLAPCVQLASAP